MFLAFSSSRTFIIIIVVVVVVVVLICRNKNNVILNALNRLISTRRQHSGGTRGRLRDAAGEAENCDCGASERADELKRKRTFSAPGLYQTCFGL